jgi:hypothetical protein
MKRNKFSLSNYKLLTCNMGELVPVNWEEVIPGDTFQAKTKALIRFTPLVAPVMHPVRVRIHHFFVPYRLIWDDSGGADTSFEAFITGGSDGTATPPVPSKSIASTAQGTLSDYLGLPVSASYTGGNLTHSMLPFRAYALIFNEYYRDQDLVTELTIDKTSGNDTTTNTTLQKVAWEKDQYTCARPWESKGDSISIPLAADANVTGIGTTSQVFGGTDTIYETGGTSRALTHSVSSGTYTMEGTAATGGYPNITADLTSATGVDVNDLLLAFGLQNFQEARAKYGSRYTEYLRYLGINPKDARLQRPEYLGGGRQTVQFSEVLATDGTNTGDIYGHGIGAMQTNRYRRFFDEHGLIMTLMSVVPKAIYSQSVDKKWLRTTKEDYFTRELAHIGDEVITNREVYCDHATPAGTFGYRPRYESYRTSQSSVHAEFCPTKAQDHWHLARSFSSDPSLNSTFIECVPPTEIFSTTAVDQMQVMVQNSIQARRPIPLEGKSKLLF